MILEQAFIEFAEKRETEEERCLREGERSFVRRWLKLIGPWSPSLTWDEFKEEEHWLGGKPTTTNNESYKTIGIHTPIPGTCAFQLTQK